MGNTRTAALTAISGLAGVAAFSQRLTAPENRNKQKHQGISPARKLLGNKRTQSNVVP